MAKSPSHVDTDDISRRITRQPFPGSAKVYVPGSRPDVRVPFREITLGDTLVQDAGGTRREANPPLRVYDASGPYTDPAATIDIAPRNSAAESVTQRVVFTDKAQKADAAAPPPEPALPESLEGPARSFGTYTQDQFFDDMFRVTRYRSDHHARISIGRVLLSLGADDDALALGDDDDHPFTQSEGGLELGPGLEQPD